MNHHDSGWLEIRFEQRFIRPSFSGFGRFAILLPGTLKQHIVELHHAPL